MTSDGWSIASPIFLSGLRAAAARQLASDTRLRAQSLFAKEGPPPEPSEASPVGRGGAKERNEAVAVRRLRSEADFAPTKWGAMNQLS